MAKKQGFLNRLIMGKERDEDYARSTLPSNRWALGWDIFKGSLGKLCKINLLVIATAIPIIILILMKNVTFTSAIMSKPFSQNMGIGYPVMPELANLGDAIKYQTDVNFYKFLPLAAVVLALGLSGAFYVIRNMVWAEGVFVSADLGHGIKKNFFTYAVTLFIYTFILSLGMIFVARINYDLAAGASNAGVLRFSRVCIFIGIGLFSIMALYMMTISATYECSFPRLVKNAFILTFALLPQNVFFVLLAFLPFMLLLFNWGQMIYMIAIVLLMLLSASTAILIWTNYSQYVFDKYINDKVEGAIKNRGIYAKQKPNEQEEKINKTMLKELAKDRLLSTKQKPVTDEEITLTELPETFKREDLIKLAEEKKAMDEDAKRWAEEHKDEVKPLEESLGVEIIDDEKPKKKNGKKGK